MIFRVSKFIRLNHSILRYSTGIIVANVAYPSHVVINMPALSPTMTQGNIGEWKKKIGDEIQPGDVLVEIETDKAQMDFECQEEGFLAKILIEPGKKEVPVGTLLCILAENKGDVEKFSDYTGSTAPTAAAPPKPKEVDAPTTTAATRPAVQESAPQETEGSSRIIASPLARSLAAEKGIDLKQIKGTGPEGRIVKEDVLNFKAPAPVKAAKPAAAVPPAAVSAGYKDIPLSNIRKVIAQRLSESKSSTPHYYMTQELSMDRILKLRQLLNEESNGKYKLSVNDFVIKASSMALLDVPALNSSWHGDFIRQYDSADIAVAVATDSGLITPILKKAESKGLATISNTVKSLADKGRAGKLAPHEYQGGTFTISNLGMYGIQQFTAIINPPHVAILAVGGVEDKLIVDENAEKGFRVAKIMKVTLNPDHRVVDGAVAAQWLQKFKGYIENPLTMLL